MCEINSKSVCEELNYQPLFENHSKALRNFIYYKSGELQLAEDIMHDSYIKLWEKCTDVFFDKAKSYLFTVANRLFLNHVENNKVVLKFEKEDVRTETPSTPDDLLDDKEFKIRLEHAISSLPEGQREVFLMNRIDKVPFKDIAILLDLSQKAVEKRMALALKALKNKVSELNTYKI
tara:strand:+ start:1081 stop:1611 length:531 start_codon:yes stop_codon:yes gene_type:complete